MAVIKKEDAKRMIVWDDELKKYYRMVLVKFDDGSCIAVHECDKDDFLNRKDFGIDKWAYCEELDIKFELKQHFKSEYSNYIDKTLALDFAGEILKLIEKLEK